MNLPVPQEQVDRWARFAESVRGTAWRLQGEVRTCGTHDADKLRAELVALYDSAAATLCEMERAGASTPQGLRPIPEVPLDKLDTPANRRLCRALREAFEAAVEVDRERGFTEEEPEDGPSALPIVELLVKVEQEVYGPSGRGEGADR